MDLGWIWLVLGTFFTIYSFYAWKKDADSQWRQLGLLAVVIVFLLISRLFFINLLPAAVRTSLSIVVWISWIPVFIALVVIVMKGRKK
jgi:hypothetical protein